MSRSEHVPPLKILYSAYWIDDDVCCDKDISVFLLDDSRDTPFLCRLWVRTGTCPWGERCRYSHEKTLVEFLLRASRGAAMPALVAADPKVVLDSASNRSVAFIFRGQETIYDYEDPSAYARFLQQRQQLSRNTHVSVALLWSMLPTEVAIASFLGAGLSAACRATAACRELRNSSLAQCVFEHICSIAFGTTVKSYAASQLGAALISWHLLNKVLREITVTICTRNPVSDWPPVDSALKKLCRTPASIALPAVCVEILLDGSLIFAVLRNGDLRCHHSDTGKLMGTASLRKFGKGKSVTCAILLDGSAFVLGDSEGGLIRALRDDLSDVILLRGRATASLSCLCALPEERTFSGAHGDGLIQVFHLADLASSEMETLAKIHVPDSSCIRCWHSTTCGTALICATVGGLCLWKREQSEVDKFQIGDIDDAVDQNPCVSCLVVLSVQSIQEALAVTANSKSNVTNWWSLDEHAPG